MNNLSRWQPALCKLLTIDASFKLLYYFNRPNSSFMKQLQDFEAAGLFDELRAELGA